MIIRSAAGGIVASLILLLDLAPRLCLAKNLRFGCQQPPQQELDSIFTRHEPQSPLSVWNYALNRMHRNFATLCQHSGCDCVETGPGQGQVRCDVNAAQQISPRARALFDAFNKPCEELCHCIPYTEQWPRNLVPPHLMRKPNGQIFWLPYGHLMNRPDRPVPPNGYASATAQDDSDFSLGEPSDDTPLYIGDGDVLYSDEISSSLRGSASDLQSGSSQLDAATQTGSGSGSGSGSASGSGSNSGAYHVNQCIEMGTNAVCPADAAPTNDTGRPIQSIPNHPASLPAMPAMTMGRGPQRSGRGRCRSSGRACRPQRPNPRRRQESERSP